MPNPVFITGAAMTLFGRTTKKIIDLLTEAAEVALKKAKLTNIDAIFLGVMNAEEFTGEGNLATALVDRLGLSGIAGSRIETASSTGAGALESAFFAVASGYLKNALVVAGEKMTSLPTALATRILAEVIDPTERRYGASMPSLAALITQSYATTYKLNKNQLRNALGAVAIKNHNRGALNPLAQFRKKINLSTYHHAKIISEPLGLYDCAPMTDGAAAMVLSRAYGDVRIAGIGHSTDSATICRRSNFISFNSTKKAAAKAYTMAKIQPKDIDFAELHDAFTMFEIIGSEDLGFFMPGQGWRAALEGRTDINGDIPLNPSGGLKARGHPIGASGLAQVVEAYWFLTNQVEPVRRLSKKPNVALTQSIGGLGNNNIVTILTISNWPQHQLRWKSTYNLQFTPNAPSQPSLPPREVLGKLIAATILYSPPEGFIAPLHLGLVRTTKGWQTLVHFLNKEFPIPGTLLKLTLKYGLYQAQKINILNRIWQIIPRIWQQFPTNLRLWRRYLYRLWKDI